MSLIVRESLSKTLYELLKKGETRVTVQVPFVNKEGESLPDEDIDYVDIIKATKELIEAGASPLFYITDEERFLLPIAISNLESSSGYSEQTKNEVIKLFMDSISKKELEGLLPEHSNLLMKQMLYHEEYLVDLINKGLMFKQDIDRRYGDEAEEIRAIRSGEVGFFLKIAEYSMLLNFDVIYNKDSYNETTLIKELDKIKEKVKNFNPKSEDEYDMKYEITKNDNRKEIIKILDNWILKNKMENKPIESEVVKEVKFKI